MLLEIKNLSVTFEMPGGGFFNKKLTLKALRHINLSLEEGQVLGVVGESGSGKSTLGRTILQLIAPYEGEVFFEGQNLKQLDKKALRWMRKKMQIVFQNPLAALDPRMTIGSIIAEPLKSFYAHLTRQQRLERVEQIMSEVGLLPDMIHRYAHEFSGGQAQRIGLARALICRPKLLVCDESVSALDVSVQAQMINLLDALHEQNHLSLIFISHDLSIVRHISTHIGVFYLGEMIEYAPTPELFSSPKHPYTQALLSAVPRPFYDPQKPIKLEGEIPSPMHLPAGCAFHTRCIHAHGLCRKQSPLLEAVDDAFIACHRWREIM